LADSLYAIIVSESGRIAAIRGRVFSQLHLNNPQAAMTILDTTSSTQEVKNLSALRLLRGDAIMFAAGDLKRASTEWEEAMRLELSDSYFEAAFMRINFFSKLSDSNMARKILRDFYGLGEQK